MDLASKVASEIIIYTKYARYLPELNRRETWSEVVARYRAMMVKKYPHLEEEITNACTFVNDKKVLPSMRMLQFAGPAIERNNSRGYNCAFAKADHPAFFKTLMFLLLGGTGVGYSVQSLHTAVLPKLRSPRRSRRWLVGDSIEGWADSIHGIMRAFFEGKNLPRFDYSDIRPRGSILNTAGGRAPGPGPLRICHDKILGLLENKPVGSRLEPWEVSDICCFIADAVLSGGIRRAAMIALFDNDDQQMLHYKSGSWWELHPERGRVNVSAIGYRPTVSKEDFLELWKATELSGSGEPGIYWTNDLEWGANPCVEIALRSRQFCNLTTINLGSVAGQSDLLRRTEVASFLGTLQAGFTDFHYLGQEWEDNCQEEALLGISITGIGDRGDYAQFDFRAAAEHARLVNQATASKVGIREAARITCIKPEGTASLVLGTSSGVHGRHAPFYIRRFRFKRDEPIVGYFARTLPALLVDDLSDPDAAILELPQKSPEHSILRGEPARELLDRAMFFHKNWIEPGHKSGENKHNVSVTVSIKPDEWVSVGEFMWDNRNTYSGISVLPYDGGSYSQPPFEDCSEETYNEMMKHVSNVDLSKVFEEFDTTERVAELACAAGGCAI